MKTWKNLGYKSDVEYKESLAKRRGFESGKEYQKWVRQTKEIRGTGKKKYHPICSTIKDIIQKCKNTEDIVEHINKINDALGCGITTKELSKQYRKSINYKYTMP